MKTKLLNLIAVILLLSLSTHAQDTASFTISILDPTYLPEITPSDDHLVLTFQQSSLNEITGQYTITAFQKAYASSRLEHLNQVYFITANSINLLNDLEQAYPDIFVGGRRHTNPTWVATITPNDFGKAFNYKQEDLKFIGAQEAWGIDSGGSNIVIGMTDAWVNKNHEDLSGKFTTTNVYPNPTSNNAGIPPSHGTLVASLIAGHTNNNIGLSSIGYLCKLSSATMSDSNILTMSKDGIRIVNASWIGSTSPQSVLDFSGLVDKLEIYNEIYENGTTVVCGAGNAGIPFNWVFGKVTDYQFPASYDHNISVSSVGHLNDRILPYDTANHEMNVKDYHQYYFADSGFRSMTHNDRVDICAPGFDIKAAVEGRLIPPNTIIPVKYDSTLSGTSCSAPFVSGTVGLMLHAKGCLSPYQVEYILKQTAKKLDTIPANLPFVGQLGAGRLNAFQAVSLAKSYNCNNPTTSTMYIDGVEVSTLCAPRSPNPIHPILKPKIVNGIPPFTYRWLRINGNKTTLDDYTSGTPAINSSTFPDVAYYLLTVTDASSVPKVASHRIKVQLKSPVSGWDLAMRDSYFDMLDEPNTQGTVDSRNQYIWASPDLWNRKLRDGLTTPQNIEYFSSGDSNYMYVRVKNVGCTTSPAGVKVKMYWTVASTGEKWDVDWKTTNVKDVSGSSSPGVPGGREITPINAGIPLPAIAAGDSLILVQAWKPQNPKTYFGSPDSVGACALARLESGTVSPFGMHTTETVRVSDNVRNNNNIVTRNMMVANLKRSHARVIYQAFVANADAVARTFSLQLITDKDIHKHYAGNVSDYSYATVYLGDLYDRWQQGGSLGQAGITDDSAKTITYDPASPIRLDNIYMDADESFQIAITFSLRDSVFVEYPVSTGVHLQQLFSGENGEEIYGNVSYELNIEADEPVDGTGSNERRIYTPATMSNDQYAFYPNPTSGMLHMRYNGTYDVIAEYCITDISGKVIARSSGISLQSGGVHSIKVSTLPPGIYLIYVSGNDGISVVQKITKEE